jgi:phosphonate transport system substrate-binding protein
MDVLKLTSCQADNTIPISREIAVYLSQHLPIPVEFVEDVPWPERYRLLDEGQIHVAWICGLPYVRRVDHPDSGNQLNSGIELLAAPVMDGTRYENRPVYFSDVVVHRDSPFQTFADLRGASWSYNEPGSQSGYNVTRYQLATLGETAGFFGRVIGSGGHQQSLRLILAGDIDASAIDSTFLGWELAHRPEIGDQIRIIATLAPSPIPPWVVLKSIPIEMRQQLRRLLLGLHEEEHGRSILALGQLVGFTAVTDKDYDLIRHMARTADRVTW